MHNFSFSIANSAFFGNMHCIDLRIRMSTPRIISFLSVRSFQQNESTNLCISHRRRKHLASWSSHFTCWASDDVTFLKDVNCTVRVFRSLLVSIPGCNFLYEWRTNREHGCCFCRFQVTRMVRLADHNGGDNYTSIYMIIRFMWSVLALKQPRRSQWTSLELQRTCFQSTMKKVTNTLWKWYLTTEGRSVNAVHNRLFMACGKL